MNRSYLLAATAAALALAGCNRNSADQTATNAAATLPDLPATLPLGTGNASLIANAPQANALPDAAPMKLVRTRDTGDAYAYADRAYGFADALGDAPPDYGFDYDGVEPWAWQAYDDSVSFAEPIDGGYRYYYYRPGAETPYFVRDPYYGYGYDDGALAAVYAADGSIVPYEDYGPRLDYASRYWTRGRDLWTASRRNHRRPVVAANWAARDAMIGDARARWFASRERHPQWAAYAAANDARRAAHWRTETVRRAADARRFDRWRHDDFRSAPPPRAIPPGWREARWARDPQRYAPAAAGPSPRSFDAARGPGARRGSERDGPDARPFEARRGPDFAGAQRRPQREGPDAARDRGGVAADRGGRRDAPDRPAATGPGERRDAPDRPAAAGPGERRDAPDRHAAVRPDGPGTARDDARAAARGRPDIGGRPDRAAARVTTPRAPDRGVGPRHSAPAGNPQRAPGPDRGGAPVGARAGGGGPAPAADRARGGQPGGAPPGGGKPAANGPGGGAPGGKPGGPH